MPSHEFAYITSPTASLVSIMPKGCFIVVVCMVVLLVPLPFVVVVIVLLPNTIVGTHLPLTIPVPAIVSWCSPMGNPVLKA